MTQLETELSESLLMQEQMFKEQLENITKDFKSQMSEALAVIERQSEALAMYESVSKNIQIAIDNEQVKSLQESHESLNSRLNSLQRQDADLLEQLNNIFLQL